MAKAKYRLTDGHRAQLGPWVERWIANAMSTVPMDEADRAACRAAVEGMYAAAGLSPPHVVFTPSPFVNAFAGGFAAGIWHLRSGNPAAEAATRAATEAATRAATRAATEAATEAAAWAATRAATEDATRDVTEAVAWAATQNATWDATRAATEVATQNATWAATRAVTEAATRAATWDATEAATRAATRDATEAATRAATAAATRAAARAATASQDLGAWYICGGAGIAAHMRQVFGPSAAFLLGCAARSWNLRQSGNQWWPGDAFLSFFQDVVRLDLPEYAAYSHWRTLAERSGSRIVHEKFCMISDRPVVLKVDAARRPHCDDGPFCRWADGSALYAIHGIRVPAWVVEHPERITVETIDAESNSEVQRVMIERYGWDRYADDCSAELLDADERWGELYRRRVPGGADILFARVTNGSPEPDGTYRRYVLPVAPNCEPLPDPDDPDGELGEPQELTALNAVASTYGLTGREYARLAVRT